VAGARLRDQLSTGFTAARVLATGAATAPAWLVIGLMALLLALLAVLRVGGNGWSMVSADDAKYLYVGNSVLAGDGPLNESGRLYVSRSPAYGIALAAGGRLLNVDPVLGGHLAALALTLAGLCGALVIGWLAAGAAGTIATGLVLAATPFVWWLVPSMRVDPIVAGLLVWVIVALWKPTPVRWVAAGLLFGIAVLVKESVALAVLLPAAWWGILQNREWLRLSAAFVGTAVISASWWWAVVWNTSGSLFPFNGLVTVAERSVPRAVQVEPLAVLMGLLGLVAWAAFARWHRDQPGPRMLGVAAIALLLPAAIAVRYGLHERQFASLILLTATAAGLVIADGAPRLVEAFRGSRLPAGRRQISPAVAIVAATVLALSTVAAAQAVVPPARRSTVPGQVADFIRSNGRPGDVVYTTFSVHSYVAVQLFGRAPVLQIPLHRVRPTDQPGNFVWMGARGSRLFSIETTRWLALLREPSVRYLVIEGPGDLSPSELLPVLTDRLSPPGISVAASFADDRRRATILAVEPGEVQPVPEYQLHLQARSVRAWLGAGDVPREAALALLEARPVLAGNAAEREQARAAVADALGGTDRSLDVCLVRLAQPYPIGFARLSSGEVC